MIQTVSSKLPNVGTTIFTVMSALASEHKAINLAQGFPNFSPPEALLHYASEAMHKGLNQYAPMSGLLSLRERIAEKITRCYDIQRSPDTEITITPGGTAALFAAMMAVVREGDEVIVFEPCYDSYLPSLSLCGARIRRVRLQLPDYTVDWAAFHRVFSEATRLVILNTPHNPSGSVWSGDDMRQLSEALADKQCLVLSDEVYEHIVFDGERHESVLRYPELAERSFVVSSFGKTYHVTGWKTGYCVAPQELMNEFRKVYQFMNFASFTPAQFAFAEMLREPAYYEELSAFYERKRNVFREHLANSRFKLLPSKGSYFQCAIYDEIADMPDIEFARWLTVQHGVAAIPVSAFYADGRDDKVIRFCFAKTDDTLCEAAQKLCAI